MSVTFKIKYGYVSFQTREVFLKDKILYQSKTGKGPWKTNLVSNNPWGSSK